MNDISPVKALAPADVVRAFYREVRSGLAPERAAQWMAAEVTAHQVISEADVSIVRTPDQYAEHVREMWTESGPFTVEIEELLADGPRVYVRWRQTGLCVIQNAPHPLIERGCAVYTIEQGRIAAYHILVDRKGVELQHQPR